MAIQSKRFKQLIKTAILEQVRWSDLSEAVKHEAAEIKSMEIRDVSPNEATFLIRVETGGGSRYFVIRISEMS